MSKSVNAVWYFDKVIELRPLRHINTLTSCISTTSLPMPDPVEYTSAICRFIRSAIDPLVGNLGNACSDHPWSTVHRTMMLVLTSIFNLWRNVHLSDMFSGFRKKQVISPVFYKQHAHDYMTSLSNQLVESIMFVTRTMLFIAMWDDYHPILENHSWLTWNWSSPDDWFLVARSLLSLPKNGSRRILRHPWSRKCKCGWITTHSMSRIHGFRVFRLLPCMNLRSMSTKYLPELQTLVQGLLYGFCQTSNDMCECSRAHRSKWLAHVSHGSTLHQTKVDSNVVNSTSHFFPITSAMRDLSSMIVASYARRTSTELDTPCGW